MLLWFTSRFRRGALFSIIFTSSAKGFACIFSIARYDEPSQCSRWFQSQPQPAY
jgi:hypothetical protein